MKCPFLTARFKEKIKSSSNIICRLIVLLYKGLWLLRKILNSPAKDLFSRDAFKKLICYSRRIYTRPSFYPYRMEDLIVRIDLVNKCNLRCRMCHFALDRVFNCHHVEISEKIAKDIARDILPFSKELYLSCGSEPFMAINFNRLYSILMSAAPAHTVLFTNGMLLDRNKSELFIRTGLKNLKISIDSAHPQTYEEIRRGAKFDVLIRNIKTFQEIKKEFKSEYPEVHFCCVLMRDNIEGLNDLIDLAARLDVKTINLVHQIVYQNIPAPGESLYNYKELTNRILEEAEIRAKKYKISLKTPSDFKLSDNNT